MEIFNSLCNMIRSTPVLLVPVCDKNGYYNYDQEFVHQYNSWNMPNNFNYEQPYSTKTDNCQQPVNNQAYNKTHYNQSSINTSFSTAQNVNNIPEPSYNSSLSTFQPNNQIETRLPNGHYRSQFKPRSPKYHFNGGSQKEIKILM